MEPQQKVLPIKCYTHYLLYFGYFIYSFIHLHSAHLYTFSHKRIEIRSYSILCYTIYNNIDY